MNQKENNSLKIAMLGHKTVPALDSSRGGVEVVVEELASRLVEMGNEVTCYNRTGCDNGGLDEYKGVKLASVFTIHRKGLAAITSSFFATIKATFGEYDVIHFHAEGPCFWMWIPHLFGKKCIATIHGIDHMREKWKWGLGAQCIKIGEKMAVKYATEIVVLSNGVQEYFWNTYQRKTVFIPNGVSKPELWEAKEITSQFGLKKNDYILFLGRIVPEKGLRYLLEAYKGLHTDKKLVIAGGSSDTDSFMSELKRMAGEDRNIIFTGFVSGRLREELYSNAYIYTLPSDLEGMPLSLLEAMSYGNCCVVSDIEECAAVVEDKAVVFRKGDVSDLRAKLLRLCDNVDEVSQYKRDAITYICSKYSWDDMSRKTVAVYRKILSEDKATVDWSKIPTCRILGVDIAAVNMDCLLRFTEENFDRLKGDYITMVNVYSLVSAYEDPEYSKVQNNAVLALPDGGPLSTIGRSRGFKKMERTAGPSYMEEILQVSVERGYSNYFYGSTEETLEKMRKEMLKTYPGLKIAGMYSPPFRPLTEDEDKEVIKRINEAQPDFIWVGLGAPKQENWMAAHKGRVTGFMVGVGAAFDYLAGNIKRAPKWMQKRNLEWVYRLIQEPRRLFMKYWHTNIRFIWLAMVKGQ